MSCMTHDHDDCWDYDNPSEWQKYFPLAAEFYQSPIHINSQQTILYSYPTLVFSTKYYPNELFKLVNNGHQVVATLADRTYGQSDKDLWFHGSGLIGRFYFVNFHLHWSQDDQHGSEHEIDGRQFPAEAHVVFKNHETGQIAVFAFLFTVTNHLQKGNKEWEKYCDAASQLININDTIQCMFNLNHLMETNERQFFRYAGSLTTPPCTEGVIWTIFTDTISIKEDSLKQLHVTSIDLYHDCFYIAIINVGTYNEKKSTVKQLIEYCIRSEFKDEIYLNANSISSILTCGNRECLNSPVPSKATSCRNKRDRMFNYLLNWHNPNDQLYPRCIKMLMCALDLSVGESFDYYCKSLCNNKQECQIEIRQTCPSAFIAPLFPVWDNHVRLGYFSNQTFTRPQFVCYNSTLCPFLIPTLIVDNYTCIHIDKLNLRDSLWFYEIFVACHRFHRIENEKYYSESTMLYCLGMDKYIPKRQVMDGIVDCPHSFDESLMVNSCALNDKYRFQCTSENRCLSPRLAGDNTKHCFGGEDAYFVDGLHNDIYRFPFSAFCDNWNDFASLTNDTDETDCEQWPCVNQYTRCNNVWNCPKGIDELNCSSVFRCPADHHPCLSPKTSKMDCLHINYTEDGTVDCLGATDERSHCQSLYPKDYHKRYRCWNDTTCVQVTDRCDKCYEFNNIDQLCGQNYHKIRDIIVYLESTADITFYNKRFFSHQSSQILPLIEQFSTESYKHMRNNMIQTTKLDLRDYKLDRHAQRCYRGILVLVGQNQTQRCFCPANYYGRFCQYQNQRITLTIRLRQEYLVQIHIIDLVIRFADHTGRIHSSEQITYIPVTSCNTKYNMYLLYQDRPKDMQKNYTIYIDAYGRVDLVYRASWLFPVKFLFMPVNRMSVQLIIPSKQDCQIICSSEYLESLRNDHTHSCRCHSSIGYPIVKHKCECSQESICFGLVNNRSICLCPIYKTGPKCYLNSTCQINSCKNNGICIPDDYRISMTHFTCVCSDGFSGTYCEEKDVRIDISFSNINIPQSFLVHFIESINYTIMAKDSAPVRITMFTKMPFDQKIATINMSLSFHLMFAQIENSYYLVVLQHIYRSSIVISTQISPSQRCRHIHELFNQTIVDYPILRRVKFYHLACQEHSDLMCFHDNEIFMCLCTKERHANCFHFNFTMNYDCLGQNDCHNNAQCFQDHPHCPKKTICVCQECFYGDKCQLGTKHFGISLDAILGYHIHSHLSIIQQTLPVKISITIATFILIIGFVCGILSNITFRSKATRITGCGLYIFISSITSMMTIIIFYMKLWFLIVSQMNIITHRSVLLIHCISIEFILRDLLASTDWIHACVTVERFLIVFLGVRFDKTKSRYYAKIMINLIFLLTTISFLHDPVHRRLSHNTEEQRTWCLTAYRSNIEIYNKFINIFHFIIPFAMNFIFVLGIIILTAKRHSQARKQATFAQQLKDEFDRHKHLILSSILLIILAVPRLIISFLPNCMKSPKEYKLYLAGYFLSFIPPLLHFFIFVLTSRVYKKEFKILMRRKWKNLRRCVRSNPIFQR
ncbi:hypothetical protein I4U23_023216 [Adineta vaga]|nr:hypothetical protein I4U23_023216 [Adineta vaga]